MKSDSISDTKLGTLKRTEKSTTDPIKPSELLFSLEPHYIFVTLNQSFAKEVLEKGPVLGAYASGITLPVRTRSFVGDDTGLNKLVVFEYAIMRLEFTRVLYYIVLAMKLRVFRLCMKFPA